MTGMNKTSHPSYTTTVLSLPNKKIYLGIYNIGKLLPKCTFVSEADTFYIVAAHSPDNSFMGFVVEHHLNDTVSEDQERKNIALVYGKNEYMWEVSTYFLCSVTLLSLCVFHLEAGLWMCSYVCTCTPTCLIER